MVNRWAENEVENKLGKLPKRLGNNGTVHRTRERKKIKVE